MSEQAWLEGVGAQRPPQIGTSSDALAVFTANELQLKTFAPIQWIAPEILPEGLTLLCGKPKLGKSWAALDLACAVAEGGQFLGVVCDQGEVLYLALEDNQRRLQDRMLKIRPDTGWPSALSFAVESQRINEGGLAAMERWLDEAENPRLIIADTLATIRPSNVGKDDYKADYAALRDLHRLSSERRIGVLVVHHVRKAEAEDVYDTVSGSTGLTGAADATLIFGVRTGETGTEIILHGKGRDIKGFQHAVEFDEDRCRWKHLGDPDTVFVSDNRRLIISALEDGRHSPSEIVAHTGLSQANTDKTLRRMTDKGQIRKTGRGHYDLIMFCEAPEGPVSDLSEVSDTDVETDNLTNLTPTIETRTT